MKKKRTILAAVCAGVLILAGLAAADRLESAWHSLSEGAAYLITREPAQVRQLRELEVAQEDEGHYEYYFQQLSEQEQRIYREILKGIRELERRFYLSSSDGDLVDRAYHALLRDHPEIFWVHNRELVYKTTYGTYTVFEPGYSYSDQEIQEGIAQCENAWQQVSALISPQWGDYEKVEAVYTWVIQNTDYVTTPADQNIEGVFADGQAVCAGYAGAVQYLLNKLGIPCVYVAGQSQTATAGDGGHAWNVVNISGSWYYLDATNGDQPNFFKRSGEDAADNSLVLYDYLCPFPEDYEKVSQPDGEFEVPSCTAVEMNPYVRNGGCFSYYDFQDVYNYASVRLQNGETMIPIKFSDPQEFQRAKEDFIDGKRIQEVAMYYMDLQGLSETRYHYGLLEELETIYMMF